jgi:hypothetical protein
MEHTLDPSEAGSVVLAIGGDVGAVIVAAPASLAGQEIEIRRCGSPWGGTHVAVRARHLPDGVIHAALFEALRVGEYEVRIRADNAAEPNTRLVIEGGRVSRAELRQPADTVAPMLQGRAQLPPA